MYLYHKDGKIILISNKRLKVNYEETKIFFSRESKKKLISSFRIKNNQLISIKKPIDITTAKIAFVTVWDIECGIATYTKNLVEEIKNINTNIKVFAEKSPISPQTSTDQVIYCWERGKSLTSLLKELHKYNPDLIYIQHEYGIFPDARRWTSFISALEDKTYFVTFHSIYNHKDKMVCEAICNNLIVHSPIAKQTLLDKGVLSNIAVIPHGCSESNETERLWNIYRSPHTFLQFGFGFEYKGWEVAIEAVNILKDKYSDIFYLILFSESFFSKDYHQLQYKKIRELIENKGLQDYVAIIRGYQTDEAIDNFLRTIKVAVFPYTAHPTHIVCGSSGAARIAMRNHTPVIVSKVPLFSDLEGIVPRINSPQELAEELDKLFTNQDYYTAIVDNQNKFIKTYSWANIAKAYLELGKSV